MAGKLNLYALGQKGVNVVKAPVQLTDDECRSAQNAIYPPDADGGLTKRGGIQPLNSSALNFGADVLAIANVALPSPFSTTSTPRRYLYLGFADLDNWSRTADGTTWTPQSLPDICGFYPQTGLPTIGLPPIQPVPGRLVYIDGGTGNLNHWRIYDGTSDQLILTTPAIAPDTDAYSAGPGGFHLGEFYFATTAVSFPRVFKFDFVTGDLTLIGGGGLGPSGTYVPRAIISFIGQLFVAATDNSNGAAPQSFVYRCDPLNATSWTTDSALLDGLPGGMVNFKGNLYITTGSRNVANAMRIYKRTPSGVYSTVFTDATPWNMQNGGSIIEFNNTLFAYMGGNIVRSSNGTAWATDLDVFTTYTSFQAVTGQPVIFNNELYWPFYDDSGGGQSRVLKRTTGGVWSVAYGPADFRPMLTVFEVP